MRVRSSRLVVLVLGLLVLATVAAGGAGDRGCANPPCYERGRVGPRGPPGIPPDVEDIPPGSLECTFGGISVNGFPVCNSGGSLIPYASGLPVSLDNIFGDPPLLVAVVGFGSSGPAVLAADGFGPFIDLSAPAVPLTVINTAFSMPRNGTITRLSAYFSSVLALLVNGTGTIQVSVWTAAPVPTATANIFRPTTVSVSMTFNNTLLSLGANLHATGTFSVFVPAETRVLLVALLGDADVAFVTGYLSAGLNIVGA